MNLLKNFLIAPSLALLLASSLYANENYTLNTSSLSDAIKQISKKADMPYIVDMNILKGKSANEVKDATSLESALEKLFEDTGLKAIIKNNTIVIIKEESSSQSQAKLGDVEVRDTLYEKSINSNFSNEANLGLFGNSNIMDMPLSVVTFTKNSIKNGQARQLSDLITQDPSVRSSGAYGDNAESFYIRGVPLGDQNAGEFAFDGIYGIAPNYKVSTDTVDAVSIVKGPGTVLFGMSPMGSVGGAINLVPKRAHKDLSEIEIRYTNKSRPGAAIDISRRFGNEEEFGARVNLAYDKGKTPINNLKSKTFSGALSLDYRGENFINSLDFITQSERLDAPFRRFKVGGGLTSLPTSPENSFNTAQDWEYSKTRENSALYKFDYFLGPDTQIGLYLGGSETGIERLFQNGSELINIEGDVKTKISAAEFDVSRITYGAKLQTDVEIGEIEHKISLDLSNYSDTVKKSINYGYANYTTNIYNPINMPKQSFSLTSQPKKSSETSLQSLALSDTISNGNMIVTLGARYQNIDIVNYKNDGTYRNGNEKAKISPFLGVVGKITNDLRVYANYTEGLSSVGVAPSYASNSDEKLDPYKSSQIEIGTKYNINNIDLTLAIFDLQRKTGELDSTLLFTPTRQLQNRGIEFNVIGRLNDDINFNAGVTYLKSKVKETKINYNNNHVGGAPELLANIGFDINIPFIQGLSLGNYFIYSSEQYITDGLEIEIPNWTRWDVGLKYQNKIQGNDYSIMFDITNVTNKAYYEGTSQWGHISSGKPRVFSLAINYKF